MELRTRSTGITEKIDSPPDRIPDYDPRSGEHLWIIAGCWKVDPKKFTTSEEGLLNHENLLSIDGPGCFYCEQVYIPLLATRRCKGTP